MSSAAAQPCRASMNGTPGHQRDVSRALSSSRHHDSVAGLYTTGTTKLSTCCSFSLNASHFTSDPHQQPSPPQPLIHVDICRCCPATSWCTRSTTKQVRPRYRILCRAVHHVLCVLAVWADHTQRLHMLGEIMRLTEQFKFESGERPRRF